MRELAGAFRLLTRLPVGVLAGAAAAPAMASIWAYPIVGAVVGGIGAAVFWAGCRLGLPPELAAVWTLAALLLTTGALHEDGLADTADGLGGGQTRARKLEIMRDSRIGSFGALALLLALAARGGALAALAEPGRVAAALVVAATLARAAMLLPLCLLGPARSDGLAASLGARSVGRAGVGVAIAVVVAFCLLPPAAAGRALAGAVATAAVMTDLARRQLGGYTGDVLGATCVVAECVVLSVLTTR